MSLAGTDILFCRRFDAHALCRPRTGGQLYGIPKTRQSLMHCAAFLRSPPSPATGPVVVLTGEDRHLKSLAFDRVARLVLGEGDTGDQNGQLGLTRFAGDATDLKTVCDELLTVSMWGDRRLVAVDEAERFVSQNREGLEKYLQKPAKKSVLLLDVKSWPKTTRLAKLVAKIGLDIDCSRLSGGELLRWIGDAARSSHGKTLSRDAAALIVELAGDDLALLDQEIAKLAAFAGGRSTIESDDVRTLVGGWKTETTWAMAGAIRRGRTGEALDLVDQLLGAGESPYKILGGLTFVFRRLAQAVERVREGASLDAALQDVGVFPREISESSAYLRRLGRAEAQRIDAHLLTADANLKGALIVSERHVLETLIVALGGTSSLPQRK